MIDVFDVYQSQDDEEIDRSKEEMSPNNMKASINTQDLPAEERVLSTS